MPPTSLCKRSTLKKYTSRASPPYLAQSCKGQTKKGNDGACYVSSPNAKGVYRWVPYGQTKKAKATSRKGVRTYEIHDNGARPFIAEVNSSQKQVDVFLNKVVDGDYQKDKKVLHTTYANIFIGKDTESPRDPSGKGNSILVHVSGAKYIYIGHIIQSFETHDKEKIKKYYSPIGNSDVPYPYAVGENHTYFLLDMKSLPNELLDLKQDGYPQFYGHAFRDSKERQTYFQKTVEPAKKSVRHKMIHSRGF